MGHRQLGRNTRRLWPQINGSFLPKFSALFLNHADAWIVTLTMGTIAIRLHSTINLTTISLIFALTTGYWLAFTLNDYFDAPLDALDPQKKGKNFFHLTNFSSRTIAIITLLISLIILSIFLQFPYGVPIFLLSYFIMWSYSAPPFRFKSRPGLDLLIHSLFVETFPYFVTLLFLQAIWQPIDYIILAFAFLSSMTAQLEQQNRDLPFDQIEEQNFTTLVGHKTTAVLQKITTGLTALLLLLSFLLGYIPTLLYPMMLIILPWGLHRLFRAKGEGRYQPLSKLTILAGFIYTLWLLLF